MISQAPSLAPEIITSDKCLNGAHISLDWSDIPEKNLYGELKEFKLCYTKVKTGETDVTETEICINLGSNVHTINLNAEYASMYKIQIAAANQNGLGVFSKPLFASKWLMFIVNMVFFKCVHGIVISMFFNI